MPSVDHIIHCRTKKPLAIEGSVAVVGSSDLLAGVKLGAEIDRHDHVFRFNLASMDSQYADAIGTKADFFFFSQNISTIRYPHPEPAQSHFKHICRKSKVICYPGHTDNISKFNKRPYLMTQNIDDINRVFSGLLGHTKWSFSVRHQPRNGVKLLSCLLSAGITPYLYGFDLADRGINAHYFDNELQLETLERGHKPSIEFKLLQELEDKKLIVIRK